MLFVNQIPIRLESNRESKSKIWEAISVSRDKYTWAETRIQFSPHTLSLSLPTDPIFRSARPSRSFRGERTSNLAELYTWVFCRTEQKTKPPPFHRIYPTKSEVSQRGGGGGRSGRCADRCVFPATSEFVRPHNLSMRTGVRAAETAIDNDIQRCIHGKRIHNDGHCAQP